MIERSQLALTLALGLLVATNLAHADDVAQAKAHFSIAARAYESNQFSVAIEAFEEAYRLAPRPAILFSIAQAHRRQYYAELHSEDLTQAIMYYRRYIRDDPKGKRVNEALSALADLDAVAARLNVDATEPAAEKPVEQQPVVRGARLLIAPSVSGATARVDGSAPVQLPNRIDVKPGRHSVVIEAAGYQPERREVEVGAGESFALDVRLLQQPAFVQATVGEGVRIYVDGRFTATTPLSRPLEVPAGPHAVGLARRGHDPVSLQLELKAGESRAVSANFSRSTQRVTSYIVFGVAGAALISGAVLTGLALGQEQNARELELRATRGNITGEQRSEHDQAIDRRDFYRAAAIGAFAGGVALAGTATLLYLFDNPEPEAGPAPPPRREPGEKPELDLAFVPLLSPDGAALGVQGSL